MRKRLAILGSTGSIGTQTIEVVSEHPGEFEIVVLTARNNIDLLIEQALRYLPKHVVVTNEEKYQEVADALSSLPLEVHAGERALEQVVQIDEIDMVITALVGFAGLFPTISALKAGKDIALANKETLVVAGELITQLAYQNKKAVYPIDSEHSALFQCLAGEQGNPIEKIYLTASGGPFRGMSRKNLQAVTRDQALNHPNWCMGNKVTIDSATLMNKGLEAIEARWLFDLAPDQVDVIVHPQSIIHSIVQFCDGSMKAQMGLPDMRLPIQYAIGYPMRLKSSFPRFSFLDYPNLSFEQPDREAFKCLSIAFDAMRKGGNMPCIMNAANEVAVEAFLCEQISFLSIPEVIGKTIDKVDFIQDPTIDDYRSSDSIARKMAVQFL
jgi:1-deoxy-D-xylulose-5-phosphate reductoisomerase